MERMTQLAVSAPNRRGTLAEICKGLGEENVNIVAILVPALLPPPAPFKIFVLLAGVARVRLSTFALAVAIGRGARYLGEGFLAVWYGDMAMEYLRRNARPMALVAAGLTLLAGVLYIVWSRRRARTRE